MAQGVARSSTFLSPGRARVAGGRAPLGGVALQTESPIRFPSAKTLYVRKTGSDNNGGDTSGTAATVTGSDGVVDGTPNFSAASGAFDASFVDRLINIVGVGRFRIEAVVGATQLTLSAPTVAEINDQFFVPANGGDSVGGTVAQQSAQSFSGEGRTLAYVEVRLSKGGAPSDNVVLEIQTDNGAQKPSGSVVASATVAGSSLSGFFATTRFTFGSPPALSDSGVYHIVLRRDGALSDTDLYIVEANIQGIHGFWGNNDFNGSWVPIVDQRLRFRLGYSGATGLTWNVGGAVQTVGALLGNGNDAVREGDTIYVGAGTYREAPQVNVAPRNGVAQVAVVGDVTGASTGDAGMVQLTGYLTDDKTLPTGRALLTMVGNSLFAFSNIFLVGGLGPLLDARAGATQALNFTDCAFLVSPLVNVSLGVQLPTVPAFVPLNWTFDRCLFQQMQGIFIQPKMPSLTGGADLDLGLVFRNCAALYGSQVFISLHSSPGAPVPKFGGVKALNCTFVGAASAVANTTSPAQNWSTSIPCRVSNCLIHIGSGGVALLMNVSGSLIEDYNVISALTARTNVAVGAHSISDGSYAPLLHFGQELQWGGLLRIFGEPMAGSPLAGFGNDGAQTAYDVRNQPRPAGGGNALPAAGAFERSNTFAKETGTVHSGTTAISAVGPAYQDFLVAVAAGTSYTFSIYVNYDASYTGTAPQLLLRNGTEAGVADQTVTAGGSAGGGWTQVSLAPFNPTSDGFLTVRMLSNDGSGISEVVFDTFATS